MIWRISDSTGSEDPSMMFDGTVGGGVGVCVCDVHTVPCCFMYIIQGQRDMFVGVKPRY